MPIRSARTAWDGGLTDGSGQTELTSSGLATFNVSWPKRVDENGDGSFTTPEELLAASHASCYSMALSAQIAKAGGTPISAEVRADVTFGPDPAGGFSVQGIALNVRAEVEGLDDAAFQEAAAAAKEGCPISRALAATPITLEAVLETA